MSNKSREDLMIEKLFGTFELDANKHLKQEPIAQAYGELFSADDRFQHMTLKDVENLGDFNKDFLGAFGQVGADFVIEQAKADDDLASLDLTADVAGNLFSLTFSRPANENPSENDWASSFGLGLGIPKPTSFEAALRQKTNAAFFAEEVTAIDDDEE